MDPGWIWRARTPLWCWKASLDTTSAWLHDKLPSKDFSKLTKRQRKNRMHRSKRKWGGCDEAGLTTLFMRHSYFTFIALRLRLRLFYLALYSSVSGKFKKLLFLFLFFKNRSRLCPLPTFTARFWWGPLCQWTSGVGVRCPCPLYTTRAVACASPYLKIEPTGQHRDRQLVW